MRSLRTIQGARKAAWEAVALLVVVLVMTAMMRLASGGEPRQITAKPGLIELRLDDAPDGADISWEARQPLTLPFKGPYESGTVIVISGTAGEQLVVVSDVIDWQARKRDKTTWVILVDGSKPPVPPDPTVPPSGLAGEVYNKVRPLNQPAVCKKLADNFDAVASQIGAGALKAMPEVAQALITLNRGVMPNNTDWQAVDAWLAAKLPRTLPETREAFTQIAVGFRAAGGAQ